MQLMHVYRSVHHVNGNSAIVPSSTAAFANCVTANIPILSLFCQAQYPAVYLQVSRCPEPATHDGCQSMHVTDSPLRRRRSFTSRSFRVTFSIMDQALRKLIAHEGSCLRLAPSGSKVLCTLTGHELALQHDTIQTFIK